MLAIKTDLYLSALIILFRHIFDMLTGEDSMLLVALYSDHSFRYQWTFIESPCLFLKRGRLYTFRLLIKLEECARPFIGFDLLSPQRNVRKLKAISSAQACSRLAWKIGMAGNAAT